MGEVPLGMALDSIEFGTIVVDSDPRRSKAFVRVYCSSIPRELMESELFGYEAGAFTGASRRGKPGKF